MSEIVSPVLQWLNANPEWAGFATFLISAGESVAIIGTIVPGSVTMTAIGTLAGAGIIPLWSTIIWAILGAVVGDGISYWMGHYFKDRLKLMWPFRNNPGVLEKGEFFVHKYGVMSVFIGRFVGPVRALVPLVAGMLGMKPLQFTIANVTSAIGWAPAYMLPGILLGAASLELPPDIALHVILVLLLITFFIVLCVWVVYKFLQLLHQQTNQFQNWIWRNLKKSKYFHSVTFLLKHYDQKKTYGQLSSALLFLIFNFAFIYLIIYVKAVGTSYILANDLMLHLFRGIRNQTLEQFWLMVTILGQKQVIYFCAVIICAWLYFWGRRRAAIHFFCLCLFSSITVFIVKHLIQADRPWGIVQSPQTFSMPSGHTTLATVFYLGLAFLFTIGLGRLKRRIIYTAAFIFILAVSFSRLYLGAHWFTDILGGWLLGAALVMLMKISFKRQPEAPFTRLSIILLTGLCLAIGSGTYYYLNASTLKNNYSQKEWPTMAVEMNLWWQEDRAIPSNQVSLFGFPSQYINVQWLGNLEEIRQTLLQMGWEKPPARNWISTLHRIADIKSTQYLPMVALQYFDKKPALVLTKQNDTNQNLIVIRLWNANRMIQEKPLWVGIVAEVTRSYSWLYKRRSVEIDDLHPTMLVPTKGLWEAKMIVVPRIQKGKEISQKIVFIRKQ